MNTTVKLKYIIIAVCIAIPLIFALSRRSNTKHQQELDKASMDLYEARRDVRIYKVQVNNLTERVTESDLIVISQDNEIFKLKEEKERLRALNIKQVKLIGALEAKVNVVATDVEPQDVPSTVDFIDGPAPKVTLTLPKQYSFMDEWVKMTTTIGLDKKADMEFAMSPIGINLVVGEQGQGFLKKRKDVFSVTTPSPYITFDETKMVLVDETPAKWPYFVAGSGVTIGVILLGTLLLGN